MLHMELVFNVTYGNMGVVPVSLGISWSTIEENSPETGTKCRTLIKHDSYPTKMKS